MVTSGRNPRRVSSVMRSVITWDTDWPFLLAEEVRSLSYDIRKSSTAAKLIVPSRAGPLALSSEKALTEPRIEGEILVRTSKVGPRRWTERFTEPKQTYEAPVVDAAVPPVPPEVAETIHRRESLLVSAGKSRPGVVGE